MANLPAGSSAIRRIVGSAPGPGNFWLLSSPARTRWQILSCAWDIHTDATPGNRFTYFYTSASGSIIYITPNDVPIPASSYISVIAQAGIGDAPRLTANRLTIPLPTDTLVPPSTGLIISLTGMEAGDTIDMISLHVLEWIEP